MQLSGFNLQQQLFEGKRTQIYRATRIRDNRTVIVKLLPSKAMNASEIRKFRCEFEIGSKFDSPSIIKYLEFYADAQCQAIIFEDSGSAGLDKAIPKEGFALREFLNIAIYMCEGLIEIHRQEIIHRDIKPSNFIMHLETGRVKYIDFGNATLLKEENQSIPNLNKIVGTLAYISPEQTGRMNRSVDYRTDFYSLGVTFYQLLTGQLPFGNKEAMALIHCHLAKDPIPVHELKPGIPEVISAIINKLMQKNSEDRYQSAQGLLFDLNLCLAMLTEHQQIPTFKIAQHDFSPRLHLSQKLYGREKEVSTLVEIFQRISTGKPEVLMVSGYSGIGKSCLINEAHKPITLQNGRFLAGKFDQLSKTIAYSAITQALQGLVKQLLSENEVIIQHWRERLLSALDSNGQLIVEVIPEVEHIIGKQPAVSILGPMEAKNRFNFVFQKFISVFMKKEHPLVLFLDDLQWADIASLELVKQIMINPDTQYFLLIGAYRSNEVDALHPAIIALEEIKNAHVSVYPITLTSLDFITVQQWITDSLDDSLERVKPLAECVYQKTHGNPFFVKMFLRSLYDDKLLMLSDKNQWQWDIEKIQQRQATDNVVEFMVTQIHKLDESAQKLVALASCLGHRFTLSLLEITSQRQSEAILADLQAIFNAGMAYQKEGSIYFAHDRVQEAAYSLLSAEEKKVTHLLIGRLLLQNYPPEVQSEKICDIVDHLNSGCELMTDADERFELARLNRLASQKAKKATAYTAALNYINAAFASLDETLIWSEHYDLAFSMYKEKAELEYLNSNFEASERLIYQILDHAQSTIEKADIYNLLMRIKILLAKNHEAIALGKTALKLFNVDLPADKYGELLSCEQQKIQGLLAGKTIDSLINAPKMAASEKIAIFELLNTLIVPAYLASYDLYALIITMAMNLVLEHGQHPEAALAYVFYASVLCETPQTAKQGYEFGLLAVKYCEKYNNSALTCKVLHIFSVLINHWLKPLKSSCVFNDESYRAGLAAGEIQYVGYNLHNAAILSFFQGEPLADVLHKTNKLAEFCARVKNQIAVDAITCMQNIIRILLGEQMLDLNASYIVDIIKREDLHALGYDYIFKAQFLYLHGRYEEALHYILEAEKSFPYLLSQYILVKHNFYHSLILAALYHNATSQEQQHYHELLTANQQRMKAWAGNCPENFQHKYRLVKAEIARIKNDRRANEFYEEAIKGAQENGFIQDESLANELAGKFWLMKKREPIAKLYFSQAFLCYQRWGAKSKLALLKKSYPDLLKAASDIAPHGYSSLATTNNTSSILLDMENVIKASQMISSEIALEKLLFNMMKLIIETAGAQQGILLLNSAGVLSIAAKYTLNGQIKVLPETASISWWGAKNIIEFVKNTGQTVILGRATEDNQFGLDPYIVNNQVKSVLCIAIKKQEDVKGLLYIENNLAYYAFTQSRVTVLNILANQMAISLDNARLFEALKQEVQERTKINANLQISEKRYRTLAQATHNIVWSANNDGHPIGPQDMWEKFTGQTYEQYQARGWLQAIHPDDRQSLLVKWQQAVKEQSIYSNLVRIWSKEGYYKYVIARAVPLINEDGITTEWIGTCLDIHALKHTEENLRALTHNINLALDSAHVGTWKWDLKNDTVEIDANIFSLFDLDSLTFNHTMAEIFQVTHPDDRENVNVTVKRCVTEKLPYEVEFRVVKKDQSMCYIANRGRIYYDEKNQPLYIVGISYDITREKERQCLQESETYRQKLEEFIDTICHELRNPLNGIYGGAELLSGIIQTIKALYIQAKETLTVELEGKLHDALNDVSEQLEIIKCCAEQQKVIVDDVLDLSKLESGKIELNPIHTNLKKLVSNVISMFKPQITQKSLKIELDLSGANNWLKIDSHRLTQVLVNLLSNAIKFTEQGGIQIIAVTKPLSKQEIQLQIAVKDTGIGMSLEEQSHLFERFKQANKAITSQYGGSGLGLVISKKLVEKMGGAIEVESQKWQGTKFTFTVNCQPLSPEEQAEFESQPFEQPLTINSSPKPLANLNILVVEDNLINQRILTKYLEQSNCFCHTANNGLEALQKYEQLRFDVILMDLEMPKMGGLEATKKIREMEMKVSYRTPIIGLSGNARHEQMNKALEAGMDDYLIKPYHKEDIYKLITQCIQSSKSASKMPQTPQQEPQAALSSSSPLSPRYSR